MMPKNMQNITILCLNHVNYAKCAGKSADMCEPKRVPKPDRIPIKGAFGSLIVMSVQMASQGKMPVVLLKDGSTETKGRDAHKNNIAASKIIAEKVRTSLGPRGMDKMLVDSLGDVTITNDGATILKEIDVQHPAAKMLVEISKTTDNEVGDGTTSAVVLAGALLENAEDLLNQDVHPTIIVDAYRKATKQAGAFLAEIAESTRPPNTPNTCLLYTSPSPRDRTRSRMPSSA